MGQTEKLACAQCAGQLWAYEEILAFLDSTNGALISASTAGNAQVSIDFVLAVTLSDSFDGALIGTGAASDTSVINDVSHDVTSKLFLFVFTLCM